MSSVPLLNLKPQNDSLREEIKNAMMAVFDSQQFILGPEVQAFEEQIASYLGVKYAIGVSSGTDALLLALMALDIGPEDEVITPAYSFFATAGSVARIGARPIFVDINPDTFNLDISQIESAITEKTKAILPVHLFGQAANMSAINEVAARFDLPVIEDAAQACGAKLGEKMVGSLGLSACFSFFPSKNLGCLGDGGLVTTDSEELYNTFLSIRNHGQAQGKRYFYDRIGGNFRLDSLQAAVLRVKLPHLDSWIEGRKRNAERYKALFAEMVPSEAFESGAITLPKEQLPAVHTYNQYVLRIKKRDEFLKAAPEAGIGLMVYYPYPLHTQPCFDFLNYSEGSMPEAERAALETLALPIYAEAPDSDLQKVVEFISNTGRKQGLW